MDELPLFPLQTVLFPGAPILLHIFEDRYKRMIQTCLEKQLPFGVVLIRSGAEAMGPLAEPYEVGCTAQITEVQKQPDGRMNLTAVGEERFHILSLDRKQMPYLVGRVAFDPLRTSDLEQLDSAAEELRAHIRRFVSLLEDSGKGRLDLSQLPTDPIRLAYWSAAILQATPKKKQAFLEAEDALSLVQELSRVYRREVSLLRTMLIGKRSEPNVFSQN